MSRGALIAPLVPLRVRPRALGCLLATLWLSAISLAEIQIRQDPQPAADPARAITVPSPAGGTGATNATSAAALHDVLRFTNHDTLHGRLLSIESPGGIRWQHHGAKTPILISPTNITTVSLGAAPLAAPKSATHIMELVNHDSFTGDVVSLDSEKLVLKTWYAGPVQIPRKNLAAIRPMRAQATGLYNGPVSLEEWKREEGQTAWKFKDGVLTCASSSYLGQDLKLPDSACLEFDVAWTADLNMAVYLYADNVDVGNGNPVCYQLELSTDSVTLYTMAADGNTGEVGSIRFDGETIKTDWHVSICVNKARRVLALLIDDLPVHVWTLPAPFAGKGTGVVFYPQSNSPMKLSDIRLTTWDGRLETNLASESISVPTDMVSLKDEDRFSGAIERIAEGNVSLTSPHGALRVPLQDVSEILFANKEAAVARAPGEVTGLLSDGGAISFLIEHWNDKEITGSIPAIGRLKFLPGAFEQLRFRDDPPPPEDEAFDTAEDNAPQLRINLPPGVNINGAQWNQILRRARRGRHNHRVFRQIVN